MSRPSLAVISLHNPGRIAPGPSMSALDVLLLAITLAAAITASLGPRSRRASVVLLAAAAILAIAQRVVEGAYLHLWPAYVLWGLAALLVLRPSLLARPRGRLLNRLLIVAASFGTIAPWMIAWPVPSLPTPTGPYAVGTEIFPWVDPAREEIATPEPNDKRNVVAQLFYPADAGARRPAAPYIDGLGALPARVSLIPRMLMRRYDRLDTHAALSAPVSGARRGWPVILLSPGYGAPRAFYTGLATELASRGFVVAAVDHPFEAAITRLADGRLATPGPKYLHFKGDHAAQQAFMARQQGVRAADLRFVLDQLGRPEIVGARLAGRLDLEHAAAIGHSFGGAAAIAAMAGDPRLRAAVNIDGTLYGDLPEQRLTRPVMLIQSDAGETQHGEQFVSGAARLFEHMQANGRRYEIKRANHFSFTDAPLFFAPPARWALSVLIGGERGPAETQRITADLVSAFLSGPLLNQVGDPDRASHAHPGVSGGPTSSATPSSPTVSIMSEPANSVRRPSASSGALSEHPSRQPNRPRLACA